MNRIIRPVIRCPICNEDIELCGQPEVGILYECVDDWVNHLLRRVDGDNCLIYCATFSKERPITVSESTWNAEDEQ